MTKFQKTLDLPPAGRNKIETEKEVETLKINEVEALVGVTKKNIRFYEEQGLLSPRRNSENGYREYGETEVETLQRIKLMRKLGVPIEEIRRMQSGASTVADAMRRHLVTLERDRRNLEQSMDLCAFLQDREERLESLDAQTILAEMEKLEQTGTTFRNRQQEDVRIRYAAPIVCAVVMVALMLALMILFFWAYVTEPQDAPPMAVMAVFILIPGAVAVGVLMALHQRIREIGKGEIDDARKY